MPEERPLPPQRQLPEPHEMQLPMSHYQLLRKPTFFEHYPWSKWLIVFIAITLLSLFSILYVQMAMLQANQTTEIKPTPVASKVAPSPTPDPTANWKTYINDDTRVSFKYPEEYKVIKEDSSSVTFDVENKGFDHLLTVSFNKVTINYNTAKKCRPMNAAPDNPLDCVGPLSTIFVNNVEAKKFYSYSEDDVIVQISQPMVEFRMFMAAGGLSETFDKILSSVKFTFDETSTFCGGIAGIQCPNGYQCKLDGNYPDAGGTCMVSENSSAVCTHDAKQCPDGSFVGRVGPKCEFAACPSGNTNTPAVVTKAKQDLEKRLGGLPEIKIVKITETEWSDSSLGCPDPAALYLQVITPGYQVQFSHNGKIYPYNTDKNANFVYCDRPQFKQ